jgi:hypothetical protein
MRLNDRLDRLERAFAANRVQPISTATPLERLQGILGLFRNIQDRHPALTGVIAHTEGCLAAGEDPEELIQAVVARLRELGMISQRWEQP